MSGYTVLMLAEDPHLYRKLGRFLEHQGCRIVSVGSDSRRQEAFHLRLDLILARVTRDDGWELAALRQVKRRHPRAKVVLCSREGETFPWEAYQLEVDDYLFLPCRPGELWRRLAACLQKTPRKAGGPAAASILAPLNEAIWEELKRVFHYIRYNLDSSKTALKPLLNTVASQPDEKFTAKIHEVSARLEVLQEMTDGFLRGISGEAVTYSLPERNYGRLSINPG